MEHASRLADDFRGMHLHDDRRRHEGHSPRRRQDYSPEPRRSYERDRSRSDLRKSLERDRSRPDSRRSHERDRYGLDSRESYSRERSRPDSQRSYEKELRRPDFHRGPASYRSERSSPLPADRAYRSQQPRPVPVYSPPADKPPIPAGWTPEWDDRYQRWYYVHEASGRSQWVAPGYTPSPRLIADSGVAYPSHTRPPRGKNRSSREKKHGLGGVLLGVVGGLAAVAVGGALLHELGVYLLYGRRLNRIARSRLSSVESRRLIWILY
ncbi:hypothetical protein GQ53DRAFT_752407 [Thozetella sp. PMI_491]|nr:hypothetical protein GQ53DRAFT_752407 [Thozetella sp. PMI_491]